MVVKGHFRQQHRRKVHQKLHFKNANLAETFPVKPQEMASLAPEERFPQQTERDPLPTTPPTNDFDRYVASNGMEVITNAAACVIDGEYFILISTYGIRQIGLVNGQPSIKAYVKPNNPSTVLRCTPWTLVPRTTVQDMAEFHRRNYVPDNPETGKKFAMSIANALGVLDGYILQLFNLH